MNHPNQPTIRGSRYLWQMIEVDATIARNLAASCNISLPAATVLAGRGITAPAEVKNFLFTPAESVVADPLVLKDSERAVTRIEQAINCHEKILIFGDYDVDGMTATSIALLSLAPRGARINFALPHRTRDGYGISVPMVEKAAAAHFSLIITVDNGITAFDAATAAKRLGIDLIITDHHEPREQLPDAYAIVNPKQTDCRYPNKELCGAGVIFKLMSLLYARQGLTLPHKVVELLMVGTIADVVPLINENRYWVRQGLLAANTIQSAALMRLIENTALKKRLSSQDIGFSIAPQLNAIGRLDDPRDGVQFLVSTDPQRIITIATTLKELNEQRKKIEQALYARIEAKIERGDINLSSDHVIIDAGYDWPAGVIGLVAGRLVNRYGRPAFLFHLTAAGMAKGSCRSIPELNIFDALNNASDLLTSFGGHSCAAGLSLHTESLPLLKQRLNAYVAARIPIEHLRPHLTIDAQLDLVDANHQLARDLDMLEPFGNGNPTPVFLIHSAALIRPPQLLKEKHVKCMIFSDGIVKPVIFFNRPDLFTLLQTRVDAPLTIAAQISRNEWNDKTSIELIGLDLAIL